MKRFAAFTARVRAAVSSSRRRNRAVATVIEAMGHWFELLRFLGAAYLIWMGWQMLPLVILLSAVTGAVTGIALVVLSIAPTIAQTIKAVFEEESVSSLFHGENQP